MSLRMNVGTTYNKAQTGLATVLKANGTLENEPLLSLDDYMALCPQTAVLSSQFEEGLLPRTWNLTRSYLIASKTFYSQKAWKNKGMKSCIKEDRRVLMK